MGIDKKISACMGITMHVPQGWHRNLEYCACTSLACMHTAKMLGQTTQRVVSAVSV